MARAKTTRRKAKPGRRQCGAVEVYHRMLERHPGFRERQVEIERFTATSLLFGQAARSSITTISVVVNVVYGTRQQNVSDKQIKSQIDALNRDYAASNKDRSKAPACWSALVANTNIRFELADVTRTKTDETSFGTDDGVKSVQTGGKAPTDPDRCLNFWVCNLSGGILGYAQFPGGPPATDGVVIQWTAFGTVGTATAPFNVGRTAVHEVGHYFNLHHIWGDTNDCSGTDYVADTPNAQLPNYGRPTFPHISCNNGPNGDMFMNYMDYVDDAEMVMFTHGQAARMAAALTGPRNSLIGAVAP
ncbi:MAG TPA: zinc metalloprotease [Pirellulales bacterium]|nr:zinc metalloprotease [Pirellulales bacterium]